MNITLNDKPISYRDVFVEGVDLNTVQIEYSPRKYPRVQYEEERMLACLRFAQRMLDYWSFGVTEEELKFVFNTLDAAQAEDLLNMEDFYWKHYIVIHPELGGLTRVERAECFDKGMYTLYCELAAFIIIYPHRQYVQERK